MKSKNTNNYRICRQRKGFGNTRTILFDYNNKEECRISFDNIIKEIGWEYYCEQEVIYLGTQFDEGGNSRDSSPSWIPINF